MNATAQSTLQTFSNKSCDHILFSSVTERPGTELKHTIPTSVLLHPPFESRPNMKGKQKKSRDIPPLWSRHLHTDVNLEAV